MLVQGWLSEVGDRGGQESQRLGWVTEMGMDIRFRDGLQRKGVVTGRGK